MGRKPRSDEPVYSRLGAFRTAHDLSRQQLADAVEVHYQTIGYLERGEYSPSLALALRIADVLDTPLEELFSLTPFNHQTTPPGDAVISSIRRARERNEEAVAANVERLMNDARFMRLRTRGARVAIVVILSAIIALMVPAWTVGGSIPGIVTVLVASIAWWVLRLSVREVADLPDRFLDERQLAVRNQVYVEAYRWFAGVMLVLASAGLVAFVVLGEDPDTWSVDLSWNWCMAVFWTVEACALAFPSMVLALRDREDVLLEMDQ